MKNRIEKLESALGSVLRHPRLPWALGLAAAVFMLPALPRRLAGDDLIQRLAQLKPTELPAHVVDTGFVPADPGTLGTVLDKLFGYLSEDGAAVRARDYGIGRWWTDERWRAALFRPVTAFTHWLDYQLFPSVPVLMHAHSIAWYAAVVLLAAALYRKVAVFSADSTCQPTAGHVGTPPAPPSALLTAGFAAILFLLDKNSYFPVAYVANRGFIISLAFGLLCLDAHLRWRTTKSAKWMWLSALFLLLALLANEGGASTLAFLLAYAIVLEPGGWRQRLASLLPAALVMLGWRAVYVGRGLGVRHFLLYIDPGYEPWLFLQNLPSRANGLLGGQLTGAFPEIALGLNTKWQAILAFGFLGFNLLCGLAFFPMLRRDRVARFWATVALLALVPAATVFPLTKNLGFVAVGAFGMIASFLVRFARPDERAALSWPLRTVSWIAAIWLLVAHIPGAFATRAGFALAGPSFDRLLSQVFAFEHAGQIGDRDLVVVNDPTIATAFMPFDRAYRGLPLPRSVRVLIPGSTAFEVTRPDASTLVFRAKGTDLFDCPDLGPAHLSYVCKAGNDLLLGGKTWKPGDRAAYKGFTPEVLEVGPKGQPRAVAYHFARPLQTENVVWLFFDWRRFAHLPFALPEIGETIEIAGAQRIPGALWLTRRAQAGVLP